MGLQALPRVGMGAGSIRRLPRDMLRPVASPRILINALSLTQGGGGRSYLVNVLHELERDTRGFDFTVLLASHDPLVAAELSRIDLARVRLPALGHAARLPVRVVYEEVALPLRAARFDLLYCPADLAPAIAGTPIVVALRNLHIYDHTYYDTLRIRVLERLVRLGVRRARRIVVPTRAAAERIGERVSIPAQRIAIVPHGVSPESFESDRADAMRSIDAKPYLFLPASVERHKRIEVLIRSLQYLEDPELEAWIAGEEVDPAYAAELRRLATELGLAARVRFLGPVPYRQILAYYRGAFAMTFTSLLETFGHPMLEAMLAGTPIIAADMPAMREIAGDIARYFPPDDPIGLARAVDQVGRERDSTKERVARGRDHAADFSWKRSIDALCRVFDEVLRERRGSVSG
jgi:glycosyltransferase involved in cell wall biosynthesis